MQSALRFVLWSIPLAAAASCARSPAPAPAAVPVAAVPMVTAAPAPSAPSSAPPAPPATPKAHYGDGDIETACNGIDDDGDGLTDVLLPAGPNICDTGLRGACAKGYAACEDGKRICLAPPPMPEVADGIDNDCNGIVDDVPERAAHPRALVVGPSYVWTDAVSDVATVSETLAAAGIPFDRQPAGTDWQAMLARLDDYALAVIPGYLLGESVTPDVKTRLEAFAAHGGVVIVWKPIGKPDDRAAWDLAGLASATRHRDVTEFRVAGTAPATAAIDSPEERRVLVNDHAGPDGIEVWALQPDPAAKTEALATAFVGAASVGAAITRRRVGKGAIYALGHDLSTFDATRCYVNCFDPAGDLLRLVFEGALREGAGGHVVLKNTAPSAASSVLVLSHDIDAPDSQDDGEWGTAGAVQTARVEKAHGFRATFNITTDYVSGYYNPKTLEALCALGMCPLGDHSVVHSMRFDTLPFGTCHEERATYNGKALTLCGEVEVAAHLIQQVTGTAPRVFRAPYLMFNPRLYDALAKNGFAYDSSFGIGDLPYNLPIDLATVGYHQDRFHHVPMLEFPISCEDGIDEIVGGKHHRDELQASNHDKFVALWRYILVENAHNKSLTTLLLHPSRGREQPIDNIDVKIRALDKFLGEAAIEDVQVLPMEQAGDFWRARLATDIDATYASGVYSGTLTAAIGTPGFTLEFGDAIKSFSCPACGPTQIRGKRVVIANPLPLHTKITFLATVR